MVKQDGPKRPTRKICSGIGVNALRAWFSHFQVGGNIILSRLNRFLLVPLDPLRQVIYYSILLISDIPVVLLILLCLSPHATLSLPT